MKPRFILLLLVIFQLPLLAQVLNTDSLRMLLLQEKDAAKRTQHIITMCEFFRSSNPDSLNEYAKKLSVHGDKHKNDLWAANGQFYTAVYYNLTGKPDTALSIAKNTIASLKKTHPRDALLMKIYSLAGNSLMRLNRQKDALEMFYSCLAQAEDAKDIDALFKAQNNIGWAYMELEQFAKAIEHFRNSIKTIHQNSLPDRYGTIYNNMASCYGSLGKYDSVYKYARAGIAIAKKYGDLAALANGHSIMGTFLAKEKKISRCACQFQRSSDHS